MSSSSYLIHISNFNFNLESSASTFTTLKELICNGKAKEAAQLLAKSAPFQTITLAGGAIAASAAAYAKFYVPFRNHRYSRYCLC
jgi:alkyl hydroperoxide reductase subunit AhpF